MLIRNIWWICVWRYFIVWFYLYVDTTGSPNTKFALVLASAPTWTLVYCLHVFRLKLCVYFASTPRDRYVPTISYPVHSITLITSGQQYVSYYSAHAPLQLSRNRLKIKHCHWQTVRPYWLLFGTRLERQHAACLDYIFKSAVRICAMDTDQWRILILKSGHVEGYPSLPALP